MYHLITEMYDETTGQWKEIATSAPMSLEKIQYRQSANLANLLEVMESIFPTTSGIRQTALKAE